MPASFKVQPSRDRAFREYVRQQVCGLWGTDWGGECSGPVEAAHLAPRGEGRKSKKASDYFCGPLCQHHHQRLHGGHLPGEAIRLAQVHAWRILVRWLDERGSK